MDADATKETMVGYKQKTTGVAQCRRKPKMPKKAQKLDEKLQSEYIALGGDKFITVRKRGPALFLNIRQYKRDAHGRLMSTKRGIMLTMAEWTQLKGNIRMVENKLKRRIVTMNSGK